MVFTIHLAIKHTTREQRHFLPVKLDLRRQKVKAKAKAVLREIWFGTWSKKKIIGGWLVTFFSPNVGRWQGPTNVTLSFYECRFSSWDTMRWWGYSNHTLCKRIDLNFFALTCNGDARTSSRCDCAIAHTRATWWNFHYCLFINYLYVFQALSLLFTWCEHGFKSSRKLCVKFKVMKHNKKKVRDCKNNVLKEGKGASVKCLVLHFNGSKIEVKEE